jgi:hypothetical protein
VDHVAHEPQHDADGSDHADAALTFGSIGGSFDRHGPAFDRHGPGFGRHRPAKSGPPVPAHAAIDGPNNTAAHDGGVAPNAFPIIVKAF